MQTQDERVTEALTQFKDFLKTIRENREINTAQMAAVDDEEIETSVKEYLERSTKRGIRR